MAENQTRGRGHFTDSPGAESPASAPSQDTGRENPGSDVEELRICFRKFSSSDESDPIKALRRLRELCGLWLRPDLHTKEQMLDRLVLEQFVTCMPPEIQDLVKRSGAETCEDLEEVLRNKQQLKKWTVVRVQDQEFLIQDLGVEILEVEVRDMHDDGDRSREPQSTASAVAPDEGQRESWEAQQLPGAKDLLRGQDQKALPPETIPETGELEGQTPSKENLEKDLLEDTGMIRTLPSQEPELLQDCEGDVSTTSGSRRGPLKNRRRVKRKRDSSPTCQDVRQEAATCLDQGEFSGQLGSHSLGSSGTVGPTSLPEGAETPGRALSECRVCKKSFLYQSQLALHQRTHTRERPFHCDICDKRFIQPSDLRVHERIHTGEKPYGCDLCPKRFTHDSTLRAHRRTHTQEKPFRCEQCDRAFGHRGNLNVHQRTHSGLKPYVCPECHGAFRQVGTFRRHQKIHSR
ncbi:zinc finger and SCAN domain-containing protein 5B-like isoform X2 [Cervus elaphus]|uniref:zinc finger and SCAN domain-containing protein 5B-like isoform X2 n=1 Tax=Cervus elaphus TaxID=9860 RepID=UPI001CC2BC39|nr:zinc finger and SCAN domain-containing protein 5B-like isoform X2 [Cervus elaphus]